MINDDVIIKYVRNELGFRTSWPEVVRRIRGEISKIKLGFPGIRNDHLSLIPASKIKPEDIIILPRFPESPHMLKIGEFVEILGLGCGSDFLSDPEKERFRWKDFIKISDYPFPLNPEYILRVDVRPSEIGGPGYYYFYRSYRDFRDLG